MSSCYKSSRTLSFLMPVFSLSGNGVWTAIVRRLDSEEQWCCFLIWKSRMWVYLSAQNLRTFANNSCVKFIVFLYYLLFFRKRNGVWKWKWDSLSVNSLRSLLQYTARHVLWLKLKWLSDWSDCKFHSDWNFKLYKVVFKYSQLGKKKPNKKPPQKCEPQRYLEQQRTLCSAICQKKWFQIICEIGPLANCIPNLFCQVPLISIGSL